MSRERNKIIAAMLGAIVVVIVIAAAMFVGLSKSGATEKTTSNLLACGEDHALAVDDGGTVYAWGHNAAGELGDVTCDNKSAPVKIEVPSKVIQVAAGNEVTFAVCKNGDLYAWGDDTSYQMGDGMNVSRMEPEKVMEDVIAAAAGDSHALVITKDHSLYVFGRNKSGALGIPDSACDQTDEEGYHCQSTPYKLMDDVTAISAGQDYSMAVTSDGTLYGWGYAVDGQIGIANVDSVNDAGEPYQSKPVKVMDGISKVACGSHYHTLALTAEGELYTWGNASVGSLSTQDVDNKEELIQTTPIKIMDDVKDIAAGSAHSVVLKNDGTAYTFGVNNYGQIGIKRGDSTYYIGDEMIYYQLEPKQFAKNVTAIAAGGFMTMYTSTDGILRTVGCNLYGQLGIDTDDDSISTPHAVYLKK